MIFLSRASCARSDQKAVCKPLTESDATEDLTPLTDPTDAAAGDPGRFTPNMG